MYSVENMFATSLYQPLDILHRLPDLFANVQ